MNRDEIVRIDCPTCTGNGYITGRNGQDVCVRCGGVGMLEKKVEWRPEGYSLEERAAMFGVERATNRLLPGDPANEGARQDE
jgi:RecJ-like exonuclease